MAIRHKDSCNNDIAKLLHSGDFSDVTLVVNSKRFPAHKAILGSRSEYFHTLFTTGLSESQQRQIEIKEANTVLFEKLLRYVYTGELDVHSETEAVEMLVMANKYLFKDLQSDIGDHLKTTLASNSFCAIYSAAYLCSIKPLKEDCLKFADSKCDGILKSEGFVSLHVGAVGEIISRPTFKPDHTLLFKAVSEWIQVNGREQSEPILSKIRLSDLPLEFLVKTVRTSGFYSETAILDAIGKMESLFAFACQAKPPEMPSQADEPMKVTIDFSSLSGWLPESKLTLEVNPNSSVAVMKQKMKTTAMFQKSMLRYFSNSLRLMFRSTLLEDHRSLEDYSIRSGDVVRCLPWERVALLPRTKIS